MQTKPSKKVENLWSRITGAFKLLFTGSQRPLAAAQFQRTDYVTTRGRNFDLEISEYPIRDPEKARELIEICEWCPEASKSIQILISSAFSSADGDDQGFTLSDTCNDETPLDAMVYEIGMGAIGRVLTTSNLAMACERILSHGDCFAELSIDERASQVNGLMFLPTWEMFRVEVQGDLQRFDQRRRLWEENAEVSFPPAKIVHWRYRRKNIYGRSLFNESLEDWGRLKRSTEALLFASESSIAADLHVMPEGADEAYLEAYRDTQQRERTDGIVTDYYTMSSGDVRRLSSNPDLKALADSVLLWRSRIIMASGVPPYLLGLPALGAKEISGQPALEYARHVNWLRACLTEGIVQVLYTEFALKGIPEERWRGRIRIVYPLIAVNVFQGQGEANLAESDSPGLTQTEGESKPVETQTPAKEPAKAQTNGRNGNGKH
jgi:hypothetical protein